MKIKQHERVLEYLKAHKDGMTSGDAMKMFGIMQMPKRIWILRQAGHKIRSKAETVVSRYGERVQITRSILEDE